MKRAFLALFLLLVPLAASASPVGGPGAAVTIVVAPAQMVETVTARSASGTAVALGVMPGAHVLRSFLAGIAAGTPDDPGAFVRALRANGVRIGRSQDHGFGLIDAFGPWQGAPATTAAGVDLLVVEATTIQELDELSVDGGAILIAANDALPASIQVPGVSGLLRAPDVRRAGVLTPYDIAARIRDDLAATRISGVGLVSVAGAAFEPVDRESVQAGVDALAARMRRDTGTDSAPSKTTSSFGIFAGLFGAVFALRGRRRIAEALARGGALVPLGYLVGMFVQTGNGALRSVPVGVAFGAGVLAKPKDSRRFCGVALMFTAALLAVLTVLAALRPDGEPALSLWGNPLTSWRFFGLRNHLVAFIAGSALLGAHLLRFNAGTLAVVALTATVAIGAPQLGANYVGVFTTVFAFALAIMMRGDAATRPRAVTDGHAARTGRWWYAAAALAAGAVATLLALWSDTSSVSHGGRALSTVRSGGAGAFWRIVRERALLDYHEVADIGWAAFIAVGLMIAIGVYLVRWAWQTRNAAVGALAAAALLALFVEDSGFFTGGTLMLYPAIGFALARAGGAGTTAAPAPG